MIKWVAKESTMEQAQARAHIPAAAPAAPANGACAWATEAEAEAGGDGNRASRLTPREPPPSKTRRKGRFSICLTYPYRLRGAPFYEKPSGQRM
jgi:hypothetical protein